MKKVVLKKSLMFAMAAAAFSASAAHAQSSVTLYGLLDAGLMYTNNVASGSSHGGLVQATSGNINGDRFGMKGSEDLGQGLKAVFTLESGFNGENGKSGQDGRLFGRMAFVGLSSNQFGTLTIGRQFDEMYDFIGPLSGAAADFGFSSFAHPYDNDNLTHTVGINNAVKYMSNSYNGFTFGSMYAFSNSTDFDLNRAYSVGASYNNGPLKAAVAYLQIDGSKGTTSSSAGAVDIAENSAVAGFSAGAKVQRTFGSGLNYSFGPATVGFVYTQSQFYGSDSFGANGGNVSFNNFELNGKYAITPAVTLGVADTITTGHVDGSKTYGASPKWNTLDLQADYSLSKRTDLYAEAMYEHVTGDNYVAFLKTSGGASSDANQVVATVGLRTKF